MSQTQEAWNQVGERFASWGRHIADRYQSSGGATPPPSGREAQRKLEEAARELTDILDRAFTAFGDTIRDERATSDLKDAVRAVGDAVSVTVTETTDQIRRRIGRTDQDRDGEPPSGPSAT